MHQTERSTKRGWEGMTSTGGQQAGVGRSPGDCRGGQEPPCTGLAAKAKSSVLLLNAVGSF